MSQTTGDDQMFTLACDECGGCYPTGPQLEGDAVDLWMTAFHQGWQLGHGAGVEFAHFCPVCSPLAGVPSGR